MGYVQGVDRNQATIVTLDVMVAPDSEARLVDAFVDSLDLEGLGFRPPAAEGRPAYDPRSMLKLYVWGYRRGVRSSRKLAASCRENVEAMWLVSGVRPDFRTISDFRKDNAEALRKVFSALVERLSGIEWLERHVDEYLGALDEADAGGADATGPLTRELVEAKLAEARKRLELYRGYRDLMEREGLSQLSLTDPDARLMRSGGGFAVAYNPQTAVDSETHLIRDFEMTNAPTDHGQLLPTMARVAQASDGVVEVVADKGYRQSEDMAACLEAGVLPHVIAGDGDRSHEVELPHEPAEGLDPSSEDPAELSRCLRAGEVPEAYEGVVAKAEVKTVRRRVPDGPAAEPYGTREEMRARAAEGYFVRDPLRELVVCPSGETLRRKGTRKSGAVVYANKAACRRCPHRGRCFGGKQEFKQVAFGKDDLEKPCRPWHEAAGTVPDAARGRYHYETSDVVVLELRPDVRRTSERMCLSEHPFGTIKRSMGADHFLLRGLEKVEGEFSLMCLAYDLARARNLLGFEELMDLMGAADAPSSALRRLLVAIIASRRPPAGPVAVAC